MTRRLRHPSPALVIALIALFVSLGGTGYAALKVSGKNVEDSSLTGKDVKNSSLTGKDVKNRSLTAKDLKGQLPAGPQGPQGAPGPSGASLPQLEPATAVRPIRPGVETCPPVVIGEFCNNVSSGDRMWINAVGATTVFWKDRSGWVHLQGRATKHSSGPEEIFILPPGFRPAKTRVFPVLVTAFGGAPPELRLEIGSDGAVRYAPYSTPGITLALDGITFRP